MMAFLSLRPSRDRHPQPTIPAEPKSAEEPGEGRMRTVSTPADDQAPSRRWSLGVVGLLIILAGAWAAVVPYVGPIFGYSSNGMDSWQWNLQHTLLYLVPGAVAVVAGFVLAGAAGRAARGRARIGLSMLALIVLACGAWLVLGPVVWPLFYSSPVFSPASAWDNFIHQLGYNLGPGLVLALLSGIVVGLGARTGRMVPTTKPATEPETTGVHWARRQSA